MYFVVPQSEANVEGYQSDAYNYAKPVQTYHYSHQDLIDTGSVVTADYVLQQQHRGMFGGYLDVPSVNTTASGYTSTFNTDDTGNENGLFWDTNWYFAPYKRSGDSQWGYKPMQTNSSNHYNAWRLYMKLNTTSNMTAGGYHIDMSHATTTVNVTGTQTKNENIDTDGTLTHQEYTTYDYKWLPFTSNEPVYLYLGIVSPSGAWAGHKDETFNFSINRYLMRYDSVTGRQAYLRNVMACYMRGEPWVNKDIANGYIKLPYNCKFVGYRIPIDYNVTKGLLVPMPKLYHVDYSVESNNTSETNKQTAELKDTTGSSTTVTNAQGVFNNTIKSKLGFVSQTADITTGLFDALTYEGEGTVPFPALKWQGQTIIAAQDVPILGYIPDIEDDVKTGVTLVLFLAWLHGIHSLYARMFLGETMVEVDEQ